MRKAREIMKPIKGFETKYLITNTGKVWSKVRRKYLAPYKDVYGYLYVQLQIGHKKYKSCKLHRLVYEAFRNQLPVGWDVDHIDENKENNNINNLVAMPHSEHIRRHKAGKPLTEEHKRKLSIAQKKVWNRKKGVKEYIMVLTSDYNYVLSGINVQ